MRFVALIAVGFFCMAMSKTYSVFWIWFRVTAPSFPSTNLFDAAFGEELSSRLANIKTGLVYEISIPDNGPKELIISADGLPELISSVKELVQAAPALEDWNFTAFRPRMDDYASFKLNYGDRDFDPQKLWCYSRVKDGHFDLIIYHPKYTDETRDDLITGTYILLDMALGEYDVMTSIRYIDHRQLPENPEANGLYRFENLRRFFDNYKDKK